MELGNEVLSTSEVITESDLTSLQNIFFNKASPRRCPSLRKSLHALVNKPTLSVQCPASTQIQNKGQVTVVLDLWNFLYFINFMFVCIKLTERSNSDFLEEIYTEKQVPISWKKPTLRSSLVKNNSRTAEHALRAPT